MIGTQWLGSISVGGLLLLGQVVENLDGISTVLQDGGRFGLIFAAMFVAYRLISKAQNDAAIIRGESFQKSTDSAKATIEYLTLSLTQAREQLAIDSSYYKSALSDLREENEKMRAELELCRREIAALRIELSGFHGIDGR